MEHARRYSKAFDYDLYKQIDEGADISKLPWKMQKKAETPWIHLDIAGTALLKADSALAPKGATGWGVLALDRMIRDRYEG